jgi:hypothetical protein
MLAPYTNEMADAEVLFTEEDLLRYEYLLNHRWAVTRMIQSYDSDAKLAYIHGFDAGMELLCEKVRLSNPGIAESVKELAGKIAEETAETLRLLTEKKKVLAAKIASHGR